MICLARQKFRFLLRHATIHIIINQTYRSLASVNETHTNNECGSNSMHSHLAIWCYRAVQQPDCKMRALGWCSKMALWHKHPDEARAAMALGWLQCSSASRRQRRQVHVHGPGPCVGWWQCSSASRWRQRIPKSTAAPPTASVGEENDAVPSCAAPRAAANSLGHLLSGHRRDGPHQPDCQHLAWYDV